MANLGRFQKSNPDAAKRAQVVFAGIAGVLLVAAVADAQTFAEPDPPLPDRRPANSAAVTPGSAPAQAPEPPKQWSSDEIEAARARCTKLFAGRELDFQPVAAIRNGPCGDPAPIKLGAVGHDASVLIKPAATVNCAFAAALDDWVKTKLPSATKTVSESRVVLLRNVASYACRNRYGATNTRLSEHALANALDIASLTFADGRTVSVLDGWGPTARDIAAAAAAAATDSGGSDPQGGDEEQGQTTNQLEPTSARIDSLTLLDPNFAGDGRRRSITTPTLRGERPMRLAATTTTTVASNATPLQQVEIARLELRVAETKLRLAKSVLIATERAKVLHAFEAEFKALSSRPLETFAEPRRRRGRLRRRGRTTTSTDSATDEATRSVPPPRKNPGTDALGRARREAEHNLNRIKTEQDRIRRREEAKAVAERRRARLIRTGERRLKNLRRASINAARQVERLKAGYDAAVGNLEAYLKENAIHGALQEPNADDVDPTRKANTIPQPGTPRAALLTLRQTSDATAGQTSLPVRKPVATITAGVRIKRGTPSQEAASSEGAAAIPATASRAPALLRAATTKEAKFLRAVHRGACEVFGTVLGPEANDAHRDHFHFDLAERRHSAFCE